MKMSSALFWGFTYRIMVVCSRRFGTTYRPSFNRTQYRAVIGLLTGHNTLRWHLYLLELQDNPKCRKCGVKAETSTHILCECEALASLRHAHLGSFFLEPKDIQSISLGAIWSFSNALGLP